MTKLSAFLIKQLFFHPLASYPGPFLGRVTSLYAAYHAWRGTLHIDMYRCHQKYGNYDKSPMLSRPVLTVSKQARWCDILRLAY
jgi:hypothetical protein